MLHSRQSAAFLLLTLVGAALPAWSCGLNHCPRPRLSIQEKPSLAWSVEHTDLSRPSGRGSFTQGALHLRYPLGLHAVLGGHLPFGFLRSSGHGHWGLANPMVYGEGVARPAERHAMTWGLQLELPLGDTQGRIASEHAMAMPYAAYAYRGKHALAHVSLGFAAQLPGGHTPAGTIDHSAHGGPAAPLQAKPHEPYELLYRISLALPLAAYRMEPEVFVSGARVAFAESGAQTHHVGAGAGLGVRLSRHLLLKPRWEQQLTHPARVAWSTGLDMKVEL